MAVVFLLVMVSFFLWYSVHNNRLTPFAHSHAVELTLPDSRYRWAACSQKGEVSVGIGTLNIKNINDVEVRWCKPNPIGRRNT